MLSSLLIKILLVEYVVIMGVCIFEGNWIRMEYWIGAILIVHATLKMR